MNFQPFPHTKVGDFAVKRSKVILGPSFEQVWLVISPQYYISRFSLKAVLDLEKKINQTSVAPLSKMAAMPIYGKNN